MTTPKNESASAETATKPSMADEHSKFAQAYAYQPGPFTNKRVTTIKCTPIEMSITTDEASSHVPPPDPPIVGPSPCGCGGAKASNSPDIMAILLPLIGSFMARSAPQPAPTPAGNDGDQPEHAHG